MNAREKSSLAHSVQVQAPHNLATSLMILIRFAEAKQPSKIEPGPSVLYQIAFIEGDAAEMNSFRSLSEVSVMP